MGEINYIDECQIKNKASGTLPPLGRATIKKVYRKLYFF